MTFGDPRYMSPEQARGDRIDRRADIYQLGCVAYEMLTGAPPFTGNRVFDILTKQVTETPRRCRRAGPGVPLWMEAAVAKMLAKDPENRFATTTRMVEALRRGLETGEVMEDEIARRRESIPPPSVSRVMQRMGIAASGEPIRPTRGAGTPPRCRRPPRQHRCQRHRNRAPAPPPVCAGDRAVGRRPSRRRRPVGSCPGDRGAGSGCRAARAGRRASRACRWIRAVTMRSPVGAAAVEAGARRTQSSCCASAPVRRSSACRSTTPRRRTSVRSPG